MGTSIRCEMTFAGDPRRRARRRSSRSCPTPDRRSARMVAGIYRTEVEFYRDARTDRRRRARRRATTRAISDDWQRVRPAARGPRPGGRRATRSPGAASSTPGSRSVNLAGLHGPRWCDPTLSRHGVDARSSRRGRRDDRRGLRRRDRTGSSSGTATGSAPRTTSCSTGCPSRSGAGSSPVPSASRRCTATTASTT